MFDDFPGPNGDIVGTQAVTGGTWATNPGGGYTSLLNTDHAVAAHINQTSAAIIANALTTPQLAAPWWLRFVFKPGIAPAMDAGFGAWMGDDSANIFFGVLVLYGTNHGVNSAEFLAGNVQTAEIDATASVADVTAEHEVVFQWDGAGNVTLLLDDVEIGTAAGVTIDPATTLNYEIYNNATIGAPPIPISLVELGRGTYPG